MWKTIKQNEYYQVNENGEIRRIGYSKTDTCHKYITEPKLVKQYKDKDGYLRVHLSKNSKVKQYMVHRLVAQHFIENDNPLRNQINHLNGNKQDNRVENLEWCTQSENRQHCLKYLNPKLRNNKLSYKVQQFDKNGNLIAEFKSANDVHRILGISQSHVSEVCRGEKQTYKGFVWKYVK